MTRRWARRAGHGLLLAVLLAATRATVVYADPVGQGHMPPALDFIKLKDSRGIPLWNYQLSIDRGGITGPGKMLWAMIVEFWWGAYQAGVGVSLWFLDWAMSLAWLQKVAAPVMTIGAALQELIGELGLVPVFLTITALMAGLWFLRGKHTTAVYEVATACLIAALATGVFAQPLQLVAGPDGLIAAANSTGLQIAGEVSGGPAGMSVEQARQLQTGKLVDTFIRQPTQMINFGRLLDGGPCEDVYTDAVRDGPYEEPADEIREAVADCDETAGKYADAPSVGMAVSVMVFLPAALLVLVMAVVMGGAVIMAGVWALFQALKAVITLVTGLLPGAARGSLLLTITDTIVALGIIVFTSVFLAAFLAIITKVFGSGGSPARTFIIVDILLIMGILIYRRQRANLKNASRRMAEMLGQRPGGTRGTVRPTQIPAAAPLISGAVALGAARSAVNHRRHKKLLAATAAAAPSSAYTDSRTQTVMFIGMGGTGASGAATATRQPAASPPPIGGVGTPPASGGKPPGGPAGGQPGSGRPGPVVVPGKHALPAGSAPTEGSAPTTGPAQGRAPRRRGRIGQLGARLVAAGTAAAAAAGSGGTSAVAGAAIKASRVARHARRAQLVAKLASATGRAATGTSTRPGSPARPATAAATVIPAAQTPPRRPALPGRPAAPTSRPSIQAVPVKTPVTARPAAVPPPAPDSGRRPTASDSGSSPHHRQAPLRPAAPKPPPSVGAPPATPPTARISTPSSPPAAPRRTHGQRLQQRLADRSRRAGR